MLDLNSKWSGKLTNAEVVPGTARGWERHLRLWDAFSSCGRQGGEIGDDGSGQRLSAMLRGVLITQPGRAVFSHAASIRQQLISTLSTLKGPACRNWDGRMSNVECSLHNNVKMSF